MRSAAKQLRFPLSGLARNLNYRESTYPSTEKAYSTPNAKNVIGECPFTKRLRGGSRPGLKLVEDVVSSSTAKWLWPNGESILWPNGESMVFSTTEEVMMPNGSKILLEHPLKAVYRDRLIKAEGSVWMASRTGEYGDFDFGGEAEDPTKACANSLALSGRKGEAITAICPINDSQLYIATKRGLAVVAGEPTSGMSILSHNVGIVSSDAWCNVNGSLFFIGINGLYAVGENGVMLVSSQIPRELLNLDFALLVYDPYYGGIHIFTSDCDFFYDLNNRAFWPTEYPPRMMPDAGGVALVNGENKVVFHCVDGKWRYWDSNTSTDDGEEIESVVSIGPFKCGVNDDIDGMLDSLNVTLGEDSGEVQISISVSNTAEGAVNAEREVIGIFGGGWNDVVRPRTRGAWCVLTLTSTNRWSYESIQANTKTLGRLR